MVNRKILKAAAVGGIVIVAAAVVIVSLNLVPKYVMESVKVITTDQSGCTVETGDQFILKISPCNARPGDTITVTYDEKIKERYRATTPP